MNIEILDTLDDLSKRPTTELAMRLMETTVDNMAKDKELERYKNIIDELERYIKTNYNYYTGVNDVNLAKKYVYKDLLDKIKNLLKGE